MVMCCVWFFPFSMLHGNVFYLSFCRFFKCIQACTYLYYFLSLSLRIKEKKELTFVSLWLMKSIP